MRPYMIMYIRSRLFEGNTVFLTTTQEISHVYDNYMCARCRSYIFILDKLMENIGH